jgi:hypothetical protein
MTGVALERDQPQKEQACVNSIPAVIGPPLRQLDRRAAVLATKRNRTSVDMSDYGRVSTHATA